MNMFMEALLGPSSLSGVASGTTNFTRRDALLGAGALVAGSSVLSLAATSVPTRQDIAKLAHQKASLAAFEAAIGEMQSRSRKDPKDPKGWLVNADAHKTFCAIADTEASQIHYCWWFLPWHRAYLSVTERKLREIAGDATLALPYWNWSSDRRIPAAYAKGGSPLSAAIRFTPRRGLEDSEVDYYPKDPIRKKLGVAALGARIFTASSPAQIEQSFGGIPRPNPQGAYGNNRLEGVPHGPVHNYVGGEDASGAGGDMSDFATAGRDPIFFAHHGNLDRLWENWRSIAANRSTEPSTKAFLDHEFPFTWLDGTVITVKVADTLDTTKLGYVYDDLAVLRAPEALLVEAQSATSPLPPIATQQLSFPFRAQSAGPTPRTILEISGVDPPSRPITVGVYLNRRDAPPDSPGESVGAFAAVKAGGAVAWPSDTLTFDITDAATRFAGEDVRVVLIPFRLRASGDESYPPLGFKQMRIVTEQQ